MNKSNDRIIHSSDQAFEKDVLQSDVPVVVDFWAPWCAPCRMIGPALEEIASEYDGKVKIVKLNVDQHNQIAGQMGVRGIPTLAFFKNGKAVNVLVGLRPKQELKKVVDGLID